MSLPSAYPIEASFWGQAEPDPATFLEGDEHADVIVVGGGLAGMSSAYFLKKAELSLDVVLVEQEYVGYGPSGRNFGNVPQLARADIGSLVRLLGHEGARFVVDHQARMLDDFEVLITGEGIDCEFHRVNCLLNAITEDTYPGLARIHELHRQFGFPSELLTPQDARREVNVPSYGALTTGRNGYQHPFKLSRGYRQAVLRAGVRLHEGTKAQGFEHDTGSVRLRTERGTISARTAVFATGAYTTLLGIATKVVQPVYTYVVATAPLNDEQWAAVGWGGRHRLILDAGLSYYYMQMRPDRKFLFGGGPRPVSASGRFPDHNDVSQYQRVHREMARRFPALASAEIISAWGGPIDMTETGMPIITRIADSVYLNVGYNGRGVLMTSLSGKILAGYILGREHADLDYEKFSRLLMEFDAPRVALGTPAAADSKTREVAPRGLFSRWRR